MRDKPAQYNLAKAVLIAWLAAGTLDITYACIVSALRGRMPLTLLQSVASGWQGTAAYSGGIPSALLGLSTHYGIMLIMVSTYAFARLRVEKLRDRPWLVGPIYGLCLYAVMYGVVLPLRFPQVFPRFSGWLTVTDIVVHMTVGLIIALCFARFAPTSQDRLANSRQLWRNRLDSDPH